jgi:hypothetical protein
MLTQKLATYASQKSPVLAADAEGDSMMNAQQSQAMNPSPAPVGGITSPEAIQKT